ncbi:DUF2852 domain-containing protein [Methylocapsa aurea]|uniref:DUF2852 domain-containing protein n=1 Tax=Methylocapsa aurea TaxID=663610 RepID=UPI0005691E58|nr:DUF2852 domain-containing protein [Methylocapsa aurea]
MSADTGRPYQPFAEREDAGPGRRGCRPGHWKPVEILAMVLGFIVYWPIGLGILVWKFWQKKSGYEGDIITFGREKWENRSNWGWACGSGRWGAGAHPWRGFSSTGNLAFDDWRAAELARLEEERQKLVQAEREFAEFMENLRRARDREEFDRFMNERRSQQGRAPGGDPSI